jgi:broad specificity phosphatase PhoE
VNVFAIRHGETAWSLSGQHTGVSDIPLTDQGRRLAQELRPVLAKEAFALVLVSPLQRARETCTLAGLGDTAAVEQDLMEWNYGEYEGLTPLQIKSTAPDWLLFRDGCAGGEMPDEVGRRVDRVISRVRAADGNVALFAHGHVLRAAGGQHFLLDTGTVCVLGYYRSAPAIRIWNAPPASLAAISSRVEPERTRCEPAPEPQGSVPQRAAPAPLAQERVQRR